ncbi:hypothetical protein D9M68_209910 [compost metagenome]
MGSPVSSKPPAKCMLRRSISLCWRSRSRRFSSSTTSSALRPSVRSLRVVGIPSGQQPARMQKLGIAFASSTSKSRKPLFSRCRTTAWASPCCHGSGSDTSFLRHQRRTIGAASAATSRTNFRFTSTTRFKSSKSSVTASPRTSPRIFATCNATTSISKISRVRIQSELNERKSRLLSSA